MTQIAVPLLLAVVDVLTVLVATAAALFVRAGDLPLTLGLEPFSPVRDYFSLWPAVLVLLAMRAAFSLYPGYGLNPAEELRRQTVSTLLVVATFGIGGTLFRFSQDYSRLVLTLVALGMLLLLPLARALTKRLLARTGLYGETTWVLGRSKRADDLVAVIERRRDLGLRIIGIGLDPPRARVGNGIKHCIVIPDDVREVSLPELLDELNSRFRRVWLVPNLLDVASVWVTPRDLDGHLALELRNNLLEPINGLVKRAIELLILVLVSAIVIPLVLVLAAGVAIESPGPVLFRQQRVGRNGRGFEILKFRTMHLGAEERLLAHLASSPEAEQEWRRHQKLRNDPRLTRVGRFLRRYSLDELPQLWNILRGEMSLVGPRAITAQELCLYRDRAHLYTSVLPGLSGLWQVSGRSYLSYEDRVRLDAYYVRNWSVWLDLAILAKTPLTVLGARGAY
jgi:Undecaprenyl-phosphate galactose phosphotransferase WbaP